MGYTNFWISFFVPVFMILLGAGIAGIWTVDIMKGKFYNQGNFFNWINDGGDKMWPHIFAEYITAAGLIIGGIALYTAKPWATPFSLVFLGALCYTSLNSMSWVFAQKDRIGYGIPMMAGLAGGVASIVILLMNFFIELNI
jgi:hypothetical protein